MSATRGSAWLDTAPLQANVTAQANTAMRRISKSIRVNSATPFCHKAGAVESARRRASHTRIRIVTDTTSGGDNRPESDVEGSRKLKVWVRAASEPLLRTGPSILASSSS